MLLTNVASSARAYGWPIYYWPRYDSAWWRCISAVLLMLGSQGAVAAEVISGAVHQWDASLDDGVDSVWEDTGTLATQSWRLLGSGGTNVNGPQWGSVASTLGMTHAYDFDGVDDRGLVGPENRTGNHDTSFELWFRPDGLATGADAWPIFEHGNEPRGLTIGLSDDLLVFLYAAGHGTYADVTFDLDVDDNGIDNPDFIQVVAVVDDTSDELRLYVDGGNEQSIPVEESNDFTSNNELGLAQNNGNGGGQMESPYPWLSGEFSGEIALLREYRTAFTLAEVEQNFAALAGATASADFDMDDDVDGYDFLTWQRGFGSGASQSTGDADFSGHVDGDDLIIWQSQFGPAGAASFAGMTIPEPTTAALLATVAALLLGRTRRGSNLCRTQDCW